VSNNKLILLGTGGTIAGKAADASDNVGYTSAQLSIADLTRGLTEPDGVELVSEQVVQVDSKDVTDAVWRKLLGRVHELLQDDGIKGIVIAHGTDTMEETAFLLQAVLNPAKPVVLTGAMRPSTALLRDGPQNLSDALAVAAWPGARGVVVVFAGRIHSALHVQKAHSYQADAFDSGDAGPLGVVEEGNCRLWQPWPVTGSRTALLGALLKAAPWPRVDWLSSHGNATGRLVWDLLAQRELQSQAGTRNDMLQGLVVAGTGNGTLNEGLIQALEEAQSQGVAVRVCSRCARGRVVSGDSAPFETAALPPAKARLALMLDLIARS
jgi:L-asparaginase